MRSAKNIKKYMQLLFMHVHKEHWATIWDIKNKLLLLW